MKKTLDAWCHQQGIDIELTAPYTPSQNRVAERANRTLVKLVRAMICRQNVPKLWEHAVAHVAYLQNRAYTSMIKEKTPYEVWYKIKPKIMHLQEFRAPIWILLQGQHVERKIFLKSKWRLYVGHDDGSNSIKYHNTETRKVLTSCNYCFLNPSPAEQLNPPNTLRWYCPMYHLKGGKERTNGKLLPVHSGMLQRDSQEVLLKKNLIRQIKIKGSSLMNLIKKNHTEHMAKELTTITLMTLFQTKTKINYIQT